MKKEYKILYIFLIIILIFSIIKITIGTIRFNKITLKEFEQVANNFLNRDKLAFISLKNTDRSCDYIASQNTFEVVRICENNYEFKNVDTNETKNYQLKDYKEVFDHFNITKEDIDEYFVFMQKNHFKRIYKMNSYVFLDYGLQGYLYTPNDQHSETCSSLYSDVYKIKTNWYKYYKEWNHTLSCSD